MMLAQCKRQAVIRKENEFNRSEILACTLGSTGVRQASAPSGARLRAVVWAERRKAGARKSNHRASLQGPALVELGRHRQHRVRVSRRQRGLSGASKAVAPSPGTSRRALRETMASPAWPAPPLRHLEAWRPHPD